MIMPPLERQGNDCRIKARGHWRAHSSRMGVKRAQRQAKERHQYRKSNECRTGRNISQRLKSESREKEDKKKGKKKRRKKNTTN
jgi:hypothetical protein